MRTVSNKAGYLVMGLDMLKGAIAVFCARFYLWFADYSGFGTDSEAGFPFYLDEGFFLTLVAFMTVVGHALPVWVKFKGGKSAAVGSGAILGINPMAWVVLMLIWFPLLKYTKIMSLSNMIMAVISPVIYWLFAVPGFAFWNYISTNLWAIIVSCSMVAFIFWRHRENIKRLIAGTERKMGEKVKVPEQKT
ncbi:hypothetical protein EU534_01045, partial [Candidatus Heimdallarchaeota archaeon]